MPIGKRSRLRALMLYGATALGGAAALAPAAFAADKPADDSGAKTVADFIAAYAGRAALPSIKVTQEGSAYLVSFDLGAATAGLRKSGVTYDPATLKLKAFQQDDGQWRVESQDFPPITAHMEPRSGDAAGVQVDARVETTNLKHTTLIDPKLNWISQSHGGADKVTLTERGPGVEEFVEIGGVKFDAQTVQGANGLTTTANEPLASVNFVMDVDPKGVDKATGAPAKPVHVSAQGEKGQASLALKDFQPGPALDAWKFMAAHPEPADLARDFEALKPILTALAADHAAADETIALDKLHVLTEAGPIDLDGPSVAVNAINNGEATGFSEHFSARAIKLPDGLVPPMFAPVIPTSFDFGFVAHGFDIEAAVKEWIADAKVEDGQIKLDRPDQDKVMAKLTGGRPIVIDIPSSHVNGTGLNLAFQGKITFEASKPTGEITLTIHDFDKTEQAVQNMGPQVAQQMTPVIAMAKGLGKPGPDGALVWVCSVGPDHVMKVNGLPLGKAPF